MDLLRLAPGQSYIYPGGQGGGFPLHTTPFRSWAFYIRIAKYTVMLHLAPSSVSIDLHSMLIHNPELSPLTAHDQMGSNAAPDAQPQAYAGSFPTLGALKTKYYDCIHRCKKPHQYYEQEEDYQPEPPTGTYCLDLFFLHFGFSASSSASSAWARMTMSAA